MIYLFDGAMGTMLQQAGLPTGGCPEIWNIERPDAVTAIHRQYAENGADILTTNTFGANRIKLQHYGLSEKVALINQAAVRAARHAAGRRQSIAGSVGPTGKLIAPLGDISFDTVFEVYKEQISALDEAGADMIIIETVIDIQEMRAALLAAKTVTQKPVICQLSFEKDGRTVTGTDPQTAAVTLEAMGADIIGANCSLGPAQLLPIVKILAETTACPIIIQPNAGLPRLAGNTTIFPMGPEEFSSWAPKLIAAGAAYLGGCCGTTPAHIQAVRKAIDSMGAEIPSHSSRLCTALTSRTKTVFLGKDQPAVVIGERINPTGRKVLAAEIREGNFFLTKKEALTQVQAGAQILDINMGVPGIDQAQTMAAAVQQLSMLVEAPFAIDTTDPLALEAGLKHFPGRALVNSVSAEPERLATFLPLAKKYGAAVLCLPIAPGGVPATAAERVKIARQIVTAAKQAGLKDRDLLLDALALTIAADGEAARQTLETLRLYRIHFGYPSAMGLSNISYGLPRRDIINAAFAAMALSAGLDAPILNPYEPLMKDILAATAVLLNHDKHAKHYSETYKAATVSRTEPPKAKTLLEEIKASVINGEKEAVSRLVESALAQGYEPLAITDQALTAAMNEVGAAFGSGHCFLPQVMLAAETMRAAFLTIRQVLPQHQTQSAGTVLLATVKGDIHDLGKNIVAALLENNGFTVIDLGKDVPADIIVKAAAEANADIVGLCALMTTTMQQIDHTISQLKAAGNKARTIVGGAVLTEEYAYNAGADCYAPNGVDAVQLCKSLMNNS